MKKVLTLPLLIIISCFIAGMYGIIHDQITYSISPEYYIKNKFIQFGLAEFLIPQGNERILVAAVGWMATWWMGLILGTILSLIAFIHKTLKQMFEITIKAILLNLLITSLLGALGYLYALAFMSYESNDLAFWNVPNETVDTTNYLRVGCIHNFGYLGGIIGLFVAIVYTIRSKRKMTHKENNLA